MTVVKSVSAGLRDSESETQLNLNRPLRISPGPRHLSRPLAAISTCANMPDEGAAMCTIHAVVVLCFGCWQGLANRSMRIQDVYVGAVPIPQFIKKKSRG